MKILRASEVSLRFRPIRSGFWCGLFINLLSAFAGISLILTGGPRLLAALAETPGIAAEAFQLA